MGLLERAGIVAAFLLIVGGVAAVYWPAALIVAGLLVGYGFFPDRTVSSKRPNA